MNKYLITLVWIFIFVFSGCQYGNHVKQSSDRLISAKWILLGLQHNDTKMYESVPADLTGMNIEFNNSNRFQANSSCNIAYGSYTIFEQNSIKLDSVVMTKMFCADSLQITWEDMYISALKSSEGFRIINDTLSIMTNSNVEIIFITDSKKN